MKYFLAKCFLFLIYKFTISLIVHILFNVEYVIIDVIRVIKVAHWMFSITCSGNKQFSAVKKQTVNRLIKIYRLSSFIVKGILISVEGCIQIEILLYTFRLTSNGIQWSAHVYLSGWISFLSQWFQSERLTISCVKWRIWLNYPFTPPITQCVALVRNYFHQTVCPCKAQR